MKIYSVGTFIKLRELFPNSKAIGDVINKSESTIKRKMTSEGFTEREQILILNHLGIENTKENRKEIFKK